MMTQHVKFLLPHDVYDGGAVLEVDGTDIAGQVRSVTVTAGVGQLTEVALELPLIEIEGHARITMTAATRRLLESYGWVAPEDAAPVAGSQETTTEVTA